MIEPAEMLSWSKITNPGRDTIKQWIEAQREYHEQIKAQYPTALSGIAEP